MKSITESKKVSLIVPVYNVCEYLDECLKTIVNQTYSNIEILLINDGSKDNSLKICQKWAENDSRIKLFDNENHGVSYTRNFGLKNCSGEYVAFVDSDDTIAENYIETLVNLIEKTETDMALISYSCFSNENAVFSKTDENIILKNDLQTAFFTLTKGMPSGKLYKKEILDKNNVKFDESICICEDLLFNIQYSSYCNTLSFNESKLYGYRQREDSAVHNTVSPKWFTVLNVYKYLFNNYSENKIYPFVVFYYLKFLYEAKYLIKYKGINPANIDIDVFAEIKRIEKAKNILSFKSKLKLFICKYFFFAVEKNRK